MTALTKKKFYFVRHGATDWNDKQLCQGQLDIELNLAGRNEAKLLGKAIQGFPFLRICSSPLKRAHETATILQSMLPSCSIELIDALKERNFGKLEGISSQEMYRIEEMEEQHLPIPQDKCIEERALFKLRIAEGINRALIKEDAPLVVSHGRVFLVLCELLNIPLIRQIPNTTLIECLPTETGWQVNFIKV